MNFFNDQKLKKVSTTLSVIIYCLIPVIGLSSFIRIQKFRLGLLAFTIETIIIFIIFNFVLNTEGIALVSIGMIKISPLYFLIKWSREWNKEIDHNKEKEN